MMLTRAAVLTWLRQPTTIAGLAALAGDAIIVATGAASWRVELPIAAGSLIAMAMPDNTSAAGLLAKTLRDVLAAIATRDATTIMAAVADAQALLVAIDRGSAAVRLSIKPWGSAPNPTGGRADSTPSA